MAREPEKTKPAAFPQHEWQRIERAEDVGFNSKRLEALKPWLASLGSTSMMVVVGGKSIFEYGDLTHLSYVASVRKSILALLYGKYVEDGSIQLDRTLADLDFTDVGGLLPKEQQATIEHLITARSGVYHPASYPGDDTHVAPPRGSVTPGNYYLYNNWDFNAAGAVFEKLTGRDIYDALETDLARPLGMQDFDRTKQVKEGDAALSQYPAYPIVLSTRDMARIGLLMLREGHWGNRQIRSREWVRRISGLATPLNDMNPPRLRALGSGERWGYGYMWWVWDGPNSRGPFKGAYSAMGNGGQYITVLPQLDMVVAHKLDFGDDLDKRIDLREYSALLRMLIAAQCPENGCK